LNVRAPTEDKINDMKDSFYEKLGRVFDKLSKHHTKILLGDFSAKEGHIAASEILQENNNDNVVRAVNFVASKYVIDASTMLVYCKIHEFTWTSPAGKTRHQIDHILTERRLHSSILDIRSCWGADRDTDHYLVVEIIRERLAVSKQIMHTVIMERFNPKKLKEMTREDQYRSEIPTRFAALENLRDDVDINRAWETITVYKNFNQRLFRLL
jgi:hypothetical protein